MDAAAWMIAGLLATGLNLSAGSVDGSALAAPPALDERLAPGWDITLSPDRVFRINGPWSGTLNNLIDPPLAGFDIACEGTDTPCLTLSVAPASAGQTPYRGSEVQSLPGGAGSTLPGYGYGYYETRMRVTDVPGVVAAFFWIEAPHYGPHEIDYEFLTNEPWMGSRDQGVVHLTLHPSEKSTRLHLPFNPSLGFHRYGFLWTPGRVIFAVDGAAAYAFDDPQMISRSGGFIMANTTTGHPDWGGGPPTRKATTAYQWFKFSPDLTDIPEW